ncbi:hypothetical protein HYV72_02000, partial [Candidatus Uhrbacteria bacterium]|nr:hypothetical protein [Candidatus Uhrbacteria bacterium]
GNVKTPSTVLEDQFKSKLNQAQDNQTDALKQALFSKEGALVQIGVSSASVFLNTLLSQLTNKIYTGLFEPPTSGGVFDPNLIDIAGRARARETFKGLLTPPVQTIEQYNVVNQFVACPGINRGPNNCVIDTLFGQAVARGDAGDPLTIQEAINEGLLHGDWPLISPDDTARNQDPFCYTYGYCHANLVKLRTARILPVGFELAAASDSNAPGAPVTLQTVVSGYNDCDFDTAENLVTDEHPWCRMIDPNWVIKYPETMCRAQVFGQTLVAQNSNLRTQTCVDTPSCISEDDAGNCTGGFGYCTRERNVWRFGGDVCPQQFASCLSLTSREGVQSNFLTNTVNFGVCNAGNAGCLRFDKNQALREEGTVDPQDDSFIWYAGTCVGGTNPNDACVTSEDCLGSGTCAALPAPDDEDVLFLDADAPVCDPSQSGCTELVRAETSSLNYVANPSFEINTDAVNAVPDFWGVSVAGPVVLDDTAANALYGRHSVVLGDE